MRPVMVCPHSRYLLTEKCSFLSIQTYCIQLFSNMVTFECTDISILASSFLLNVFASCDNLCRVRKWTSNSYEKVAMALILLSFYKVLAICFLQSIPVISNIASFYYLAFLFVENRRGYEMVLWVAMTTSEENSISWIAVEDCWLSLFEFFLYYWSLDFVVIQIRIPFFSLYFLEE